MINKDQTLKVANKRQKRVFSLEDKQRFYLLWKESGLNRSQFCKKNDLILSAFTKWGQKMPSEKDALSSKNDWIPVVSTNKTVETKKSPTLVEIKVPNTIKICGFLLCLILFLKELFHAINTIW